MKAYLISLFIARYVCIGRLRKNMCTLCGTKKDFFVQFFFHFLVPFYRRNIVAAWYNATKSIPNQGLEKGIFEYCRKYMIKGTYISFCLLMVLRRLHYHGHDHFLAGVERGAWGMATGSGCTAFICLDCWGTFQNAKKRQNLKFVAYMDEWSDESKTVQGLTASRRYSRSPLHVQHFHGQFLKVLLGWGIQEFLHYRGTWG